MFPCQEGEQRRMNRCGIKTGFEICKIKRIRDGKGDGCTIHFNQATLNYAWPILSLLAQAKLN